MTKKINIATHYKPRKINNFQNMVNNADLYSDLIIVPIYGISAGVQNSLRHVLSNHGHKPFKIVNKIAIKVMQNSQLEGMLKGQLMFIGTKDMASCMQIVNKFKNIKPICGLMNHKTIIQSNTLFSLGAKTAEQHLASALFSIEKLVKRSTIDLMTSLQTLIKV